MYFVRGEAYKLTPIFENYGVPRVPGERGSLLVAYVEKTGKTQFKHFFVTPRYTAQMNDLPRRSKPMAAWSMPEKRANNMA